MRNAQSDLLLPLPCSPMSLLAGAAEGVLIECVWVTSLTGAPDYRPVAADHEQRSYRPLAETPA